MRAIQSTTTRSYSHYGSRELCSSYTNALVLKRAACLHQLPQSRLKLTLRLVHALALRLIIIWTQTTLISTNEGPREASTGL